MWPIQLAQLIQIRLIIELKYDFLTPEMCTWFSFFLDTSRLFAAHGDIALCLRASEKSRRVKYWSQHHRYFLTGQTDNATTILYILHVSSRELTFLVAHFLTAGSATQPCSWSWRRDSKSGSGTLQPSAALWLEAGGWTLVLHPEDISLFIASSWSAGTKAVRV